MLQARTFKQNVDRMLRLSYWLFQPDGYGTTNERWPLILFLHGAGERGDELEQLKVNGIP
jgi:predicted peptidase